MRKVLFTLLCMLCLAVPVMAQTYSQEEAKSRAEELFNISGYSDFEICNNENYSVMAYDMIWNNDNDGTYTAVTIRSDGDAVYYFEKGSEYSQDNILTAEQCKKTADDFILKLWENDADNIKFVRVGESNENSISYEFYYTGIHNGIENISDEILIEVNKYSNKIRLYKCGDGFFYPYYPFDISTFEEAKDIIEEGLKLGYTAVYDRHEEKYNVKLIYDFENYQIRAEDFSPIYTDYDMFTYSDNCLSTDYNNAIPDDFIKIEKPKNAISEKKAVKIYNKFYNTDFSVGEIEVKYGKSRLSDDDYLIYVNGIVIDSEGRILGIDDISMYWDESHVPVESKIYSSENMTEYEIGEKVIEKLNVKNYKLTDIRLVDNENSDTYICNIIRNGIVSFDERICVEFYDGEMFDFSARYADDDIFNISPKAKLSREEAFEAAVSKMELNPYYYKEYTGSSEVSYVIAKMYGFRDGFTINANSGVFYDYEKNIIKDNAKIYDSDVSVFSNVVKKLTNFKFV